MIDWETRHFPGEPDEWPRYLTPPNTYVTEIDKSRDGVGGAQMVGWLRRMGQGMFNEFEG